MSKVKCVKVTLSTGKVVLLREMKIRHTELAAQEVSPKSNGDANLLQILMNQALVKQLIFKIDEATPSQAELEDLDELFSIAEYSQLLKVVGKMAGGDSAGKSAEPLIEIVNSGDK